MTDVHSFLLAAHDYFVRHQGKTLHKDQKKHLRTKFVKRWELVPNTARLCIMNLYLRGIDADPCPVRSGVDNLASDPREQFSVVLTNPPFGKKSSISIVNEAGYGKFVTRAAIRSGRRKRKEQLAREPNGSQSAV